MGTEIDGEYEKGVQALKVRSYVDHIVQQYLNNKSRGCVDP